MWDGVGTPQQRREAAWTYNPAGKKLSLTDARGFRAEMTYDGFGRQQRWVFPSKATPGVADQSDYEQYRYDVDGNRTSLRKRDGSTLSYQYDALNRMSVKIVPERSGLDPIHTRDVYYGYDNRGLQTGARFNAADGYGLTFWYNGFGEPLVTLLYLFDQPRYVTYGYDPNGNRIQIVHPDEQRFTYSFDGLDRPTHILESGVDAIDALAYDWAGRRAAGAWYRTLYGYDPAGRIQSISHNPEGTTRDPSSASPTIAHAPVPRRPTGSTL